MEYFGLLTAPNANSLLGATGGLFFAGGVVGPLLLPWLADKFGRKWAIATVRTTWSSLGENFELMTLQGAILQIISAAVMAGSTHIAEFIAFRFVSGAGAFILLAAIPVGPTTLGNGTAY